MEPTQPKDDDIINTSTEIGALEEAMGKVECSSDVPGPSQCCVNGLGVAVVGKEKELSVVLKDDEGNPIPEKCPFQYQLRKVGEDPDEYIPPRVTVTHGTATLAFTLDQPGEYELTIMVRNKPIANPFKITAKRLTRDYSKFTDMQVTYKNIEDKCAGVAVHDNGTVYATDLNSNTIKVFKPNGEETEMGSSKYDEGDLSSPWGIAINGDTIYVASSNNNTIKMYSSTDGKHIGRFGGDRNCSGLLGRPFGICTDGKGRVLVADVGKKRIQIYTSQGDFIKYIECTADPYGVAVDPEGNIHAALLFSNHVAIYSEDGDLIDTYNFGETLEHPSAIYIDDEGNRLIGTTSKALHLADPTGTLIATIPVDYTYSVTMDKRGTIYVAEFGENRVAIYT